VSEPASCHLCGAPATRRTWIVHKQGCTLRHDAADCREAGDITQPCRFLGSCHVERRTIAVQAGLRGANCWAFSQRMEREFAEHQQVASKAQPPRPDPEATAERSTIQGET